MGVTINGMVMQVPMIGFEMSVGIAAMCVHVLMIPVQMVMRMVVAEQDVPMTTFEGTMRM